MILGLIEHDRGKLNELSLQMLTLARRMATQMDAPLHALLIGPEARGLAERLPAYGVSTTYVAEHARLDDYAPEAWAQTAVEVMQGNDAQVVLATGTERGNEVMAHVAARADLPLAANCIDVQVGDPLVVTRLRWGGSLLEEARVRGATKLLTVAPHAIAAERASEAAEAVVKSVTPKLDDKDLRVRVTSRIESGSGKVSLGDARVVVGGGRGVGSAEGFKSLEELADLLGGTVGCSRAVTSLGWRPHADQVGQTGTRIAPELYIACGVSGAIQHMIGCKSAKHILAVNTDPEAPIVTKADYAVIGDLHQVLPAVIVEVKKVQAAKS